MKNNKLSLDGSVKRKGNHFKKRRTKDLHGLGYKRSKVMTPSFDLHLMLLNEVLLNRMGGGSRAQIGLKEKCDV